MSDRKDLVVCIDDDDRVFDIRPASDADRDYFHRHPEGHPRAFYVHNSDRVKNILAAELAESKMALAELRYFKSEILDTLDKFGIETREKET